MDRILDIQELSDKLTFFKIVGLRRATHRKRTIIKLTLI